MGGSSGGVAKKNLVSVSYRVSFFVLWCVCGCDV